MLGGPEASGEKQQEVLAQNLTELQLPAVTETEIAWDEIEDKEGEEEGNGEGKKKKKNTTSPPHTQLSQRAPRFTFTVQRSKQAAMLFPGNKCLSSWRGVNTDIMLTGN